MYGIRREELETAGAAAVRSDLSKGKLTLPRFHVHQIAGKLLMNGGRYEQERIGSKPAVYR